MTPVSHGKPCAGNPHARFDEGTSAPEEPRRKALLHKLTKSMVSMAVALSTTVGYAGLSSPFLLDMISGMRIARESESIAYSTTWEGVPSDSTVVVSVDGTTLITATEEGSVAWTPATNGTYTLTHKVMSRGTQYGETLTAIFRVVGPKVGDVVAKQRFPWNGLVDITCSVTGINGTTNGPDLAVAAVMPDSGNVRTLFNFWVVQNGKNSNDRRVHANGDYHLLWDAQADLGAVIHSNMVMRVAVKTRNKVQLWEGGPYWAETNIGAEEPWEYGYYFWWGDTVGYKWENDAWVASDGSSSNFSFASTNTSTDIKSIATLKSEGWITADGVLAPEHDAAHVQWGGSWRMPTDQEVRDLYSKCDWTWMFMNGVQGYVVKGKGAYASASIFLPCAGFGEETSGGVCHSGRYWSSVPLPDPRASYFLYFDSNYHGLVDYSASAYIRYHGHSVRPVQGLTE